MANHKSAKKRARQNITRATRNASIRSEVRTAVRRFREAVEGSDKDKLTAAFQAACRELRRAGSKGVYKAANVSRRVSRLASAFNTANS